jgi:hypothetical protein
MRGFFFATLRQFLTVCEDYVYFEGKEIETDSEGYLKDTPSGAKRWRKLLPKGRDHPRR